MRKVNRKKMPKRVFPGRSRPSLRELFGWRYTRPQLHDLPAVTAEQPFRVANAGFAYEYQFVDVQDYEGQGETCPAPHFYQNRGEAELAVAMFMYMRLLAYPTAKIAILTTYNGQRALLKETIRKRYVQVVALRHRTLLFLSGVAGTPRSDGPLSFRPSISSKASKRTVRAKHPQVLLCMQT